MKVISVKNILSLLLVFPTLLFSQIDGSINGYIYDSKSQLPLLGANVIIEGTEKGYGMNKKIVHNMDFGNGGGIGDGDGKALVHKSPCRIGCFNNDIMGSDMSIGGCT